MKKAYLFTFIWTILLYSLAAHAQDTEADFKKVSERKAWGFSISPYAWLAGQSADVGGESLRQSFNDLSSLTNFGFQLSAQARYKRFILSMDGTYADLGASSGTELLSVDFTLTQWIIDTRLGYLIYDDIHYKEDEVIAGWSIEGHLGAKYWRNDIGVSYALGQEGQPPLVEGEIDELQDWWDLMLGVKTRFVLSKRVLLGVGADIGGFGIGNSSDLAWDVNYYNTFRITRLINVTAGYRSFNFNRTEGEGDAGLETKVRVYGPLLGISFVL
jgi:hypothetical protein